jgi:hypothetical protein
MTYFKVQLKLYLDFALTLGFCLSLGFTFTQCTTNDAKNDESNPNITVNDPYPIRLSDLILPMEGQPTYLFHHVEYGDSVNSILLTATSSMHFTYTDSGFFAWETDYSHHGPLLMRRQTGPADSLGLYIAGTFVDSIKTFQQAEMWLPDHPENWKAGWKVGNREVTVAALDTSILLPIPEGSGVYSRDPSTGRYWVQVTLIREVEDSVTTIYSFARGIGMVAYQRSRAGKLQSTGLVTFAVATSVGATLWPR